MCDASQSASKSLRLTVIQIKLNTSNSGKHTPCACHRNTRGSEHHSNHSIGPSTDLVRGKEVGGNVDHQGQLKETDAKDEAIPAL